MTATLMFPWPVDVNLLEALFRQHKMKNNWFFVGTQNRTYDILMDFVIEN